MGKLGTIELVDVALWRHVDGKTFLSDDELMIFSECKTTNPIHTVHSIEYEGDLATVTYRTLD